jgi:hypothetical protein
MVKATVRRVKVKRRNSEARSRWQSVYDAPVDQIRREFRQLYGRYPTEFELNDIVLEGEW